MSSSKPKSAAEEERQKHRDRQGKYASYKPGTSAADELSGIGEEVVFEADWRDLEEMEIEEGVDWYVGGVKSVSIIRNKDGSLSADVTIDVDDGNIAEPALRELADSYPGAYSREFDTPYDWTPDNRPSEYLLGEETQDPDNPSLHVFRVPLESTSAIEAVKEAGKVLDTGDYGRPPGPAAARVHEAVKYTLVKKQRVYDIKSSATKWALKAAGAPEDVEIDGSAFAAIDYAVDDFLREHPGSFDDVPADELGQDLIKARCFSGGFTTNRNRYGKKAEDLELEAHNQGGIRFWVGGDPEYDLRLMAHVEPPVPPGIAHQ